jgi:hypothetical protein
MSKKPPYVIGVKLNYASHASYAQFPSPPPIEGVGIEMKHNRHNCYNPQKIFQKCPVCGISDNVFVYQDGKIICDDCKKNAVVNEEWVE